MSFGHQPLEIVVAAIILLNLVIIGRVVAVIARGFGDRHQPDAVCAQIVLRGGITVVDVIELFDQAVDVAHTIAVAVVERAHKHLVTHRVVPPTSFQRKRLNRSLRRNRCCNLRWRGGLGSGWRGSGGWRSGLRNGGSGNRRWLGRLGRRGFIASTTCHHHQTPNERQRPKWIETIH